MVLIKNVHSDSKVFCTKSTLQQFILTIISKTFDLPDKCNNVLKFSLGTKLRI